MAQWTVAADEVTHMIRRFKCSQPDGSAIDGFNGVDAMTGTAIQTFHQQLLGVGLPFRVNVNGAALVTSNRDDLGDKWGFRIPPVSVNPLQHHGMNTWADFVQLVRTQLTLLAEELRGMASGVSWLGILTMEVTYVPQDNLAAFQPHLQAVGGGAKHALPPDLVTKHCALNILNDDNQCFRCCLISWKLEIYNEAHADRWGNYLTNLPRNGKKPKGWKPQYRECGLDLSMLPWDRGTTIEHLALVELANPGLGIYVYVWHEAVVDKLSQHFQVIVRIPPDPLKVKEALFLTAGLT